MSRCDVLTACRAAGTVCVALMLALPLLADGASLDAVTPKEASSGLRAALSQGVDKAISRLGAPNGFLENPKYTISLPPALQKADRALRMIGMSGDTEKLKTAMNHAAEVAVADARPIFKQAVLHMSLKDAKGILTGGETAGTDYFRKATSTQLSQKFKPIVAQATAKMKARQLYDEYAGKAEQVGFIRSEDANLNDYVTAKAMDALFAEIGAEEKAIRKDPLGQSSALVKKVFGSL
ncbi:MAG TPA: DUF4197 domain-containing protein [Steroidobacteraceae bacterium]|jgi:hypothetical protein